MKPKKTPKAPPTPRTDILAIVGKVLGHDGFVPVNFARVLELQLRDLYLENIQLKNNLALAHLRHLPKRLAKHR